MKRLIVLAAGIFLGACQMPNPEDNVLIFGLFHPNSAFPAHGQAFGQPYQVTVPPGVYLCSDYASHFAPSGASRMSTTGIHQGIDLCGSVGTDIIAATDGIVMQVGLPGWGDAHFLRICHTINLDNWVNEQQPVHGRGIVVPVCTHFEHMAASYVQVGDRVVRGQHIGEMGNAGYHSGSEVHLHFEIRWRTTEDGVMDYLHGNLHRFWADGPGRMACFDENRDYDAEALTLPVRCR